MSSKLREELKDKEYRDAFVAANVRNGIAFQIRAMRDSRGWDQKKLAVKMGKANLQPIISRYENPDYGRFSVSTLLELAKAFDVGLVVRFEPFSEIIKRDENFSDSSLDVDSYGKELLAPLKPTTLAGEAMQVGAETVLQIGRVVYSPTVAVATRDTGVPIPLKARQLDVNTSAPVRDFQDVPISLIISANGRI